MRRFFIDENAIDDNRALVTGNLFCHMSRALRLKIGAMVVLCDGKGRRHRGEIESVARDHLIVGIRETTREPEAAVGPIITLYQGLPKGSKMEFILQKCTELGVNSIAPFVSQRSVARLPKERENERMERWRRIVMEAARQSSRSAIPALSPVADFSDLFGDADQAVKLLLWEEERSNRLRSVLHSLPLPDSVALLVGPEGGLSEREAEAAADAGFIPVTLGNRILRTETAGMAILAVLQFYWGDMG